MVVLATFDVSTIFDKSKLIFDEKDEETGSTKKGDPFLKKKFKYMDEEKKTSLIVRFSGVESWGLEEFKNKGKGGKSFSFNIVLDLTEEEIIQDFVNTLEKVAKKGLPKDLKKAVSFDKFSPIKNGNLYCRVPFNPQNESFFCRFQDRKEIGRPEDFLNAECLVDAAVQFSGVFVSNARAFLQVDLLQVRKLEERILLDYLGPYKPKETPFKAQTNRERDQLEIEEEYSSQDDEGYDTVH